MASYNVHAGHNFKTHGACGYLIESKVNREVKDRVIALLQSLGHTVYDCTDEDGAVQSENLANIVAKCNAHAVDLDISIHFNAFNTQARGTQVYIYDETVKHISDRICERIASLGYTNRGSVVRPGLYVLKYTNSPAVLVECCFCDNKEDAELYNPDTMAKAIVEGVVGTSISSSGGVAQPQPEPTTQLYRVRKSWEDSKSQLGAYKILANAIKRCEEGYYVFDSNGNVVYPEVVQPEPEVEKLYRVRKSWDDEKSQLGAYKVLDNAKKSCQPGYTVYDWDGTAVYSVPAVVEDTTPEDQRWYRIRKSWEDSKSQLGAYKDKNAAIKACKYGYTVYDWLGNALYTNDKVEAPDISPLAGVSNQQFLEYIGPRANEDMKKTGVLASVTVAQAILESGWGQTELARKANNLFGMKSTLSGNTWESEWGGKVYNIETEEEYQVGVIILIRADFRAYDDPAKSIKDHSDYLCGAKNGSKLRYAGLKGERDYKKAIQIIKDGGYATASTYVEKIVSLIERYNLTQWDVVEEEPEVIPQPTPEPIPQPQPTPEPEPEVVPQPEPNPELEVVPEPEIQPEPEASNSKSIFDILMKILKAILSVLSKK